MFLLANMETKIDEHVVQNVTEHDDIVSKGGCVAGENNYVPLVLKIDKE